MNIKTKDGQNLKLIQFVRDSGSITSKPQTIAVCVDTKTKQYVEVPVADIVEMGM